MDNLDYKDSVEKLINEESNLIVTKITVTKTIVESDQSDNSGTAFVTNNQNGMGSIVSPQP